jgi:hypothetical protein
MIAISKAVWRNQVPIAILLVCFTLGTAGCSTTNNNGNCDAQGASNGVTCIATTNGATDSPSATASPTIVPIQTPIASISQAILDQALLPAQTLGSATVVDSTNTDPSQVIELCGGAPPDGALLTSGQTLQNNQDGTFLWEGITYYESANEASQVMRDDINTVGQTGCSYSNNGNTEQYGGPGSMSLPQGCTGPTLGTTTSTPGYSGYHVQVACGNFAIGLNYMMRVPEVDSQEATSGYLNNLVGRLMKALGSGG